MDFTLTTYRQLIEALKNQGFLFQTFVEFLERPRGKSIVLRHDVDKYPANSLIFAEIQHEMEIRGTYFFRIVRENWNEVIIRQIAEMGHEIGYHYEDLGTTAQWLNGATEEEELVKIAIESFSKNLQKLRDITPVKTICMHGSPMSRWDSRLLWKYYDYRDFGIIGEPYFDVDYNDVLYLTDTGRRWDGGSFNIRDKAQGLGLNNRHKVLGTDDPAPGTRHPVPFPELHSTFDIIRAAEEGQLPDKIMITFHPQRWTDKPGPWVRELVWQNVKNVGKYFLIWLKAEGCRQ